MSYSDLELFNSFKASLKLLEIGRPTQIDICSNVDPADGTELFIGF